MEFSLIDIVLLTVIAAVAFQFWRIRAISERAKTFLENYCKKQGLQFIDVARSKTRLTIFRARIDWYTEFTFAFSSTGEERYSGLLCMKGLIVTDTQLPAYRIN